MYAIISITKRKKDIMSKSYEKKSQIINKRKKQMDSIKQLIAKENYPKARSELLHYL